MDFCDSLLHILFFLTGISGTALLSSSSEKSVCCQKPEKRSTEAITCYNPTDGYLDLSHSNLTRIPLCIKSPVTGSIQQLDLDDNLITDLDFNLYQITEVFPNLTSLTMSKNMLLNLKRTHSGVLVNLELLDISQNSISQISEAYFKTFPKMKKINLRRNELSSLPKDIFKSLKNIAEIDLSFNKLKILEMTWFQNNGKLYSLLLTSNIIGSWKPFTSEWPESLTQLNLSMNKLPGVPPLPSSTLNDKPWFVDLRNNPVWCGCRLKTHSYQILTAKVACGLLIHCTENHSFTQPRFSVADKCTKKQEEEGMKWLSTFVQQTRCTPAHIVNNVQISKCKGQKSVVKCEATGYPAPNIRLLKMNNLYNEQAPFDANVTHLELVLPNHIPNLTCKASNYFGDDEHSMVPLKEPCYNEQILTDVQAPAGLLNKTLLIALSSVSLILSVVVLFCTTLLCSFSYHPDQDDISA